MFNTKRKLLAVAATGVFAMVSVSSFAQDSASPQGEAVKLVAVLKSDAPAFDKAKACQRLAVVGTKEAVPVLAGLLDNEELAHYARFGLEPIPDPSVDDALREAMGKLKGKLLVGVINSIGVRRDTKAFGGLTRLMGDADADVAAAAAAAVGRLGSSESAKVLRKAMAEAAAERRAAVAQACLPCAEALLADGKRDEAAALYDAVLRAEVPKHIQGAATRGAILARGADGVPLLVERLKESDYFSFTLALGLAHEMPGKDVTRALVAELGELAPERRALVLGALGRRGDATALPAVLEAAKSGPAAVRVAAIGSLGGLGDASAVPVLVEAAASEGEVAEAARTALEGLGGKKVDDALAAMLERGDSELRPILIDLLGRRRVASAIPALRKAAEEKDENVRLAAIKALGNTIGLEDLPALTARLLEAKTPQETAAVQEALKAASMRMPDRDACAGKLAESMAKASLEAKCLLLDLFSFVGGTKALEVVSANARGGDEKVREAATRVLSEWKSEDAASELLELTKGFQERKDRMRTLRAFSEMVRRLGFQKEKRIGVCEDAMRIARNSEERKLVLFTLAGIPAPETLAVLDRYMSEAELREDACSAAVTICERLIRTKRDAVRDAMKKVLSATEDKDLAARARKLYERAGGKP